MKKNCLIMGILASLIATAGCGGADQKYKPRQATHKTTMPFGDQENRTAGPENSAAATNVVNPQDLKVPGNQFGNDADLAADLPFTDQIVAQMEEAKLAWGMNTETVMHIFEQQIRASYKEDLKEALGAIEEDRVRTDMLRQIATFKATYVEFDGERTGYEGTFVAPEFTHKNNESMLMYDAGQYVEYLFFFEGRLWKRIRAFRKDSFKQNITFGLYISTLESRFGRGQEFWTDRGALAEIKWQDDTSYMSARDQSDFFGVFCLVFTAKMTEHNLDKLRTNNDSAQKAAPKKVSGVVNAISSGEANDDHTSVIDSYTGEEPSTDDGF